MKKTAGTALLVLVLALAAALTAGLTSCAQRAQTSASGEAALYGSPWVSGISAGNLPDAAPAAADDLYLHYAYDYAAAHQDAAYASAADDAQGDLHDAVTAVIKDGSAESPS